MPSLDGSIEKLRRAKEHVEELKREIAGRTDEVRATLKFETRINADQTEATHEAIEVPEVPIRLSVITGDVIQNFRSALDYLVYELVALDNGEYWEDTQFPLVSEHHLLGSNHRFKGTLERLKPEHRAFIESVQPYESVGRTPRDIRFNLVENRPLAVLRDISDEDKHRAVLSRYYVPRPVGEVRVVGTGCLIVDYIVMGYPLQPGAKVVQARIAVTKPPPSVKVHYDFVPVVYLAGKTSSSQGAIDEALDRIGARVTSIVRKFEPLFES